MDFLNKSWQSLVALLREMTPGTRMLAALLLVAIVISLVYLLQFHSAAPDEFLLGGRAFSSGELAAIEAAFAKKQLAQYEIRGPQVRIPRGQRAVYVAAMAEANALPPDAFTFLTDAVSSGGMFESDEARRQKMNVANQQLLSHVIGEMQGIGMATVQFREVVRDQFRRKTEMVAMVAVRPEGAAHLNEEQVRTIRDMVAAAIGGQRDNITITDLNAGRSFTGAGPDGLPAAVDDPYAQRKKMYERD